MPSKSMKQHKLMQAVAHNPDFAKKVDISQEVGKEFEAADKKEGKYQMKRENVESLLTSIITEDKEGLKEGLSKALLEKIAAKLEEKKQIVSEEMFGGGDVG